MLEAFQFPGIRVTGLGTRFSDSTAALMDPSRRGEPGR
jgi:hypothetical protein